MKDHFHRILVNLNSSYAIKISLESQFNNSLLLTFQFSIFSLQLLFRNMDPLLSYLTANIVKMEEQEALATVKEVWKTSGLESRKFVGRVTRARANPFLCLAGNLSRYRPPAIQWVENVTRTRHRDLTF